MRRNRLQNREGSTASDRYFARRQRSSPAGRSPARSRRMAACHAQARPGSPRPAANPGRRLPRAGARDQPRSGARCSAASVSSTKALASSMPQTNNSNRSATRGSAGSRRAKRRLRGRPMGQERRMRAAESAARRAPAADGRTGPPRFRSARSRVPAAAASAGASLGGSQHIGADITREGLGHGEALDSVRDPW